MNVCRAWTRQMAQPLIQQEYSSFTVKPVKERANADFRIIRPEPVLFKMLRERARLRNLFRPRLECSPASVLSSALLFPATRARPFYRSVNLPCMIEHVWALR
jgi:hypothetical protein